MTIEDPKPAAELSSLYTYITYREIIGMIRKKLAVLLSIVLICALAGGACGLIQQETTYTSSGIIYLLPHLQGNAMDYFSISITTKLFNSLAKMMNQEAIMNEAAALAQVDTISDKVSFTQDSANQMLTISASSSNPQEAQAIVQSLIETFQKTVSEEPGMPEVVVLQAPKEGIMSKSRNPAKDALMGGILGVLAAFCWLLWKLFRNPYLQSRSSAENALGLPVLAVVPADGKKEKKS